MNIFQRALSKVEGFFSDAEAVVAAFFSSLAHSIATNGAARQRAMTTRTGVTTGAATSGGTSGTSDISRLRPLTDHLCNAQAM